LAPLKVTLENLARHCTSRADLLRGRFAPSVTPAPRRPTSTASTASSDANNTADRIGHWLCRLAVAAAGDQALSRWWATAETTLFARRLAELTDPAAVESVLTKSGLVRMGGLVVIVVARRTWHEKQP